MNKINFKIKGMNCNSCALLIVQELKKQPGVVEAKVDFNSKSGLAIYDKTKIQKQDIFNIIKKMGDYQVEEAGDTQPEEGKQDDGEEVQREKAPRGRFVSGLLTGGGVVFLLLMIFFNVAPRQFSLLAQVNSGSSRNQNPVQNEARTGAINEAQKIETFVIAETDHIRGNQNAAITLVEFSDFECPFCERQYQTMKQLLAEYPQKIRLVYKHFPLGFHANAQKAAEASECAWEQDKFWEYHDKLFENQADYSVENFKKWAKSLGLKANQFNDCLDAGKYAKKVQADAKEGEEKGVSGTPATFINGQLITGALPYATFKEAVDSL